MQSAFLVIVDPGSRDGTVDIGFDCRFKEVRRIPVNYEIADSLGNRIVSLPLGGGDLCFNPVFAIELRENDTVQWAGAACFDCGTFCSLDRRGRYNGSFDMTSTAAKQLLAEMRAIAKRSSPSLWKRLIDLAK